MQRLGLYSTFRKETSYRKNVLLKADKHFQSSWNHNAQPLISQLEPSRSTEAGAHHDQPVIKMVMHICHSKLRFGVSRADPHEIKATSWSIWLFQDFIKCTRINQPTREECILTFYLTIYCAKFWFQLRSTTIILHHILERNSDKPLVCRCHYWSTQRHIWNVMCSIKGEHCLLSPDKKGAQSKHSHYIYPKCFLSFQIIRCSVFF
jgi:hypothetical protein